MGTYVIEATDYPDEPEDATERLLGVLEEIADATIGRAQLDLIQTGKRLRQQEYRITDCLGQGTKHTRSALVEVAALAVKALLALDAPGESGERVAPAGAAP